MVGDMREGSRKWGFALGWMLTGSWANSMIGYLHESYLEEGKTRSRLKL